MVLGSVKNIFPGRCVRCRTFLWEGDGELHGRSKLRLFCPQHVPEDPLRDGSWTVGELFDYLVARAEYDVRAAWPGLSDHDCHQDAWRIVAAAHPEIARDVPHYAPITAEIMQGRGPPQCPSTDAVRF